MNTKLCDCGKRIFFAKDEQGKTQVLDEVAPVYVVDPIQIGEKTCRRLSSGYVSHFSTCALANNFSKSTKQKGLNSEQSKPSPKNP